MPVVSSLFSIYFAALPAMKLSYLVSNAKPYLPAKLLASNRKRKSFMDFDAVRNWVGDKLLIEPKTLYDQFGQSWFSGILRRP